MKKRPYKHLELVPRPDREQRLSEALTTNIPAAAPSLTQRARSLCDLSVSQSSLIPREASAISAISA